LSRRGLLLVLGDIDILLDEPDTDGDCDPKQEHYQATIEEPRLFCGMELLISTVTVPLGRVY
jgi:hypothetical protein